MTKNNGTDVDGDDKPTISADEYRAIKGLKPRKSAQANGKDSDWVKEVNALLVEGDELQIKTTAAYVKAAAIINNQITSGMTQTEVAKALGRSQQWVSAFVVWSRSGDGMMDLTSVLVNRSPFAEQNAKKKAAAAEKKAAEKAAAKAKAAAEKAAAKAKAAAEKAAAKAKAAAEKAAAKAKAAAEKAAAKAKLRLGPGAGDGDRAADDLIDTVCAAIADLSYIGDYLDNNTISPASREELQTDLLKLEELSQQLRARLEAMGDQRWAYASPSPSAPPPDVQAALDALNRLQ